MKATRHFATFGAAIVNENQLNGQLCRRAFLSCVDGHFWLIPTGNCNKQLYEKLHNVFWILDAFQKHFFSIIQIYWNMLWNI